LFKQIVAALFFDFGVYIAILLMLAFFSLVCMLPSNWYWLLAVHFRVFVVRSILIAAKYHCQIQFLLTQFEKVRNNLYVNSEKSKYPRLQK